MTHTHIYRGESAALGRNEEGKVMRKGGIDSRLEDLI